MGCSCATQSEEPALDANPKQVEQNNDFMSNIVFLQKVPLLQRLPPEFIPVVAAALEHVSKHTDEMVIQQGDMGLEFYIIQHGKADVLVDSEGFLQKVASLGAGDYFGENALLHEEPRTATIKAAGPLKLLMLTSKKFQDLGLRSKLQFAKRKAVGGLGPAVAEKEAKRRMSLVVAKSSEEESEIAEAIKMNANLASVVTLDDTKVKILAQAALKETIAQGTTVITQGSAEADFFYVIQEGQFEVYVGKESKKCVSVLNAGDSFGELAMLYFAPRAATIVAATDSTVWMIDRSTFKQVLLQESKEKIKEYSMILSKVQMLSPLLEEERMKLASALTEVLFDKNHEIIRQGDQGSTFYILIDGAVEVTVDGKMVHRMTASSTDAKTESFGEKALLENNVRAATVKVTSPQARALAVDRDTFTALLGSLEDIQKGLHGEGHGLATNKSAATRRKIARTDLDPIGLLGCGGFGAVELVEHSETQETFALKKLSKGHILQQGMQQSVINEKSIMFMSNSDFIVKLYATFNTSQSLCFLMEVALGGELYATYNVRSLWGSERHAKYYLAGVALAFEHLHERFVLYRDLKPENVLLNADGRPKLTDMGLAKFAIEKTYTTCGTPDYFAPEVISTTGQTCAVDWWTLGIMTFELMCGRPPFEAPTPLQTYAKVLKGISKVSFPPRCQGAVADLVRSTLKKDPADRLPMRPGKASNVKQHKWYNGFSWDDFANSTMEPPYMPEVKSASDIANFSASKEDMPPQIHYCDDGSGWDADFAS